MVWFGYAREGVVSGVRRKKSPTGREQGKNVQQRRSLTVTCGIDANIYHEIQVNKK